MIELEEKTKKSLEFMDDQMSEGKSPGPEDIDGIVGHGMQLAAIQGLCAKTLADSKLLLGKRELIFMNDNRELWNQPTILKRLMEAQLAEYYSLVVWADRLSAACTHKMDFYRSVLSKHKEELRMNQQFNQR